jgi:hypothetical protein
MLRMCVLAGQAVVQFARRDHDDTEFAIKFFLDNAAFHSEVALFTAYFPALKLSVDMSRVERASALAGDAEQGDEGEVDKPEGETHAREGPSEKSPGGGIQGGRFLPHVEAVCDSATADLVDPKGHPLPPCIVMERGESLQEWSDRADPDYFTVLSVCPTSSHSC